MAITLSERAAQRVKAILDKEGRPEAFLRIGVKGGGCSGLSYTMGVDTQARDGDKVFESGGVKVVCDFKSYLYLNNTEMDWEDGLLQSGFRFRNPNATRACGCGESFSVAAAGVGGGDARKP